MLINEQVTRKQSKRHTNSSFAVACSYMQNKACKMPSGTKVLKLKSHKLNSFTSTANTPTTSNRSYLDKPFHIWRSGDAFSRHLVAHDMCQVHDIAQHKMILYIQKTYALQKSFKQTRRQIKINHDKSNTFSN